VGNLQRTETEKAHQVELLHRAHLECEQVRNRHEKDYDVLHNPHSSIRECHPIKIDTLRPRHGPVPCTTHGLALEHDGEVECETGADHKYHGCNGEFSEPGRLEDTDVEEEDGHADEY
jgi:hypothetical protein